MLFNYRARDLQGAAVEGQIQAQTTEQVVQQLRQQGLVPVRIVEAKNLQTGKASLLERLESISTVSLRDKAVFFRQLSTMTKAGVTLASALDLLSRQTQNKRLARAIVEIKDLIDKGQPFSAALRPQKIFSPLMVAMVAAGEEGGLLDESVERLASLLERQDALHKKIVSAVTYPALVLCFAFVMLYAVVTFIVPRFAKILGGLGVPLPALTRYIFSASLWLQRYWYVPVLVILLAVVAFYLLGKNEKARPMVDGLKLKLPVAGDILHKTILARSLRTLASLVEAGVPILSVLDMTASVAGNAVFESAFARLSDASRKGRPMGEEARKCGVFPPMVTHMITVGEQTGQLEGMLNKVAEFVEVELDEKVKRLTSILEPLLLIVIGGVVGVVVLSIYLPIISSVQALM